MKTFVAALAFVLVIALAGCGGEPGNTSMSPDTYPAEGQSSEGVVTRELSPEEQKNIEERVQSLKQRIEESTVTSDMKFPPPPKPPKMPKPPKVPPAPELPPAP